MSDDAKKKLIGAVIAAALAFAVYYGLISQQTATSIQNQTNQTLGTSPASQQAAPAPQTQPAAPPTPQPRATQPTPGGAAPAQPQHP